jgi:hypothetical protein
MKTMKCAACGYEYRNLGANIEDAKILAKIGYAPFIEIRGLEMGPFTTRVETGPESCSLSAHYVTSGVPVTAYACPKCFTLRIEVQ